MKKTIPIFVLLIILGGCSYNGDSDVDKSSGGNRKTTISVACWNVQTFFDSEVDGTEYADYKNLSKWSKDKYLIRLGRLCQVMTSLNADVFVLEEIENSAVIQDIANQLAGRAWSKKNNWNYATFAKIEGTAIGCGVFSKYPLSDGKVHYMDIKTQNNEQPQTRPILQVKLDINGQDLVLLVNHWKSKSGGEEESEIWRDWQELVCESAVEKISKDNEDYRIVVCGDFNRSAEDFITNSEAIDNLNTQFRGTNGNVKLYNPWLNRTGTFANEKGSYYFQGTWERIDNIFITGNIKLSAFAPKYQGDWAEASGIPKEYKLYNGEGYSDHLPLMCFLELF